MDPGALPARWKAYQLAGKRGLVYVTLYRHSGHKFNNENLKRIKNGVEKHIKQLVYLSIISDLLYSDNICTCCYPQQSMDTKSKLEISKWENWKNNHLLKNI